MKRALSPARGFGGGGKVEDTLGTKRKKEKEKKEEEEEMFTVL